MSVHITNLVKRPVDIPKSTNFSFLGPDVRVPAIRKVILKHGAVALVGHILKTIPDQETGKCKSNENTKAGNNVDPFLLGVFLVQPRLLKLALLDSSGVEISLWRHVKSG